MTTEGDRRPSPIYKNHPRELAKIYTDSLFPRPHEIHIDTVVKVIANYPQRDELGVLIDLSTYRDLDTFYTPALAHIFTYKPEILP